MILALSAMACAQNPDQGLQTSESPKPAAAQQPATAPRLDPTRQMELDLDQMDSLVNNMATQVSFIQDTNMSILLNTNVRLWSVLLRDLRLQLQEQQRHAASEKSSSPQKR